MSFTVALTNVLITLLYIVPGYLLRRAKRADPAHLPTLSAILVYVGTPVLEISAFLALDFSVDALKSMGLFFVVTLVLECLFILLLYFALRSKINDAKYRVLSIASICGNVGFFGLPVVRALLPDHPEVACYSTVYMVSMNIIMFTLGVYMLTRDRKYISLRSAVLNPTVLGFAVALPLYIFGARDFLPAALQTAISTVGAMTTPLCMFILGIRLASAPIRNIINKPVVYVASAMKLIVFPLFCYGISLLLPVDFAFRAALLVLAATPCAAITLTLSEMHRVDAELPADCILVSTVLCFITIPLLTLLVG